MIDATVDDGTTTFHMEPGMVAIVGDVSVTGNIAVTGTVDGVDVSGAYPRRRHARRWQHQPAQLKEKPRWLGRASLVRLVALA